MIKKNKLFFLIFLLLISSSSYAFNWKKCKKEVYNEFSPVSTTGGPIGSTLSYVSSTGGCSATAMIHEDQKKLYVAQNLDNLQIDIARGQGEYLDTYASLSGCHRSEYLTRFYKATIRQFSGRMLIALPGKFMRQLTS